MDDFRLRDLERYRVAGTRDTYSIPLPRTASGKTMHQCPRADCRPGLFQLGEHGDVNAIPEETKRLMRRLPATPGTTCPYCGHDGDDQDFISKADVEHVKKLATWAAANEVSRQLGGMARDFNARRPRGGLIDITMEVKGGRASRPLAYREDLLRDLTCGSCARRYGVYAIGIYCPECGLPNLLVHFDRELALIRSQIALARAQEETDAELAYRLLGNAHEDVLTAFETYLKTFYRHVVRKRQLPDAEKLAESVKNKFQNVERARALIASLQLTPFDVLGVEDLTYLTRNIEKRHVIGHNLGIVDEAYAESEEDVGETVPLLADEIERFAALCRRVVEVLERSPDLQHPGVGSQAPHA